MARSLGNVVDCSEIADTVGGEALRLFCVSHHFRSPVDFDFQAIRDADQQVIGARFFSLEAADRKLEYFYTTLKRIDDFVAQRCLLVARADHLASVDSPQLFAAVDKLHVAGQHRHAAEKMVRASDIDLDLDLAITLVLIRRYKLRKVASFDKRFAGYDITLIEPVTSPVEHSESVEN